jgi:hypothetical protein
MAAPKRGPYSGRHGWGKDPFERQPSPLSSSDEEVEAIVNYVMSTQSMCTCGHDRDRRATNPIGVSMYPLRTCKICRPGRFPESMPKRPPVPVVSDGLNSKQRRRHRINAEKAARKAEKAARTASAAARSPTTDSDSDDEDE